MGGRCSGTPSEQFACRPSNSCSWCLRRRTGASPATTGARSKASSSRSSAAARRGATPSTTGWSRRCLPMEDLRNLIEETRVDQIGGILALPVAETVKKAAKDEAGTQRVAGTEDRTQLWLAQTPQMFRAGL